MDRQRLIDMVSQSVLSLCRHGMIDEGVHKVQGLIGITLKNKEVILISLCEQFNGSDDDDENSRLKSNIDDLSVSDAWNSNQANDGSIKNKENHVYEDSIAHNEYQNVAKNESAIIKKETTASLQVVTKREIEESDQDMLSSVGINEVRTYC